jgi:hypothetical protein
MFSFHSIAALCFLFLVFIGLAFCFQILLPVGVGRTRLARVRPDYYCS